MNPTLAHLRALLERALTPAENPALLRLPEGERTVLGLCLNYIGGEVAVLLLAKRAGERRWANLSEPTRARALLLALALALGLDPGVGGVGVSWFLMPKTNVIPWHRWCLMADRLIDFADLVNKSHGSRHAPTVAAEPDPIKALALAVLHILEAPRG